MFELIACNWMTLDGVVQSPSYPDEDTSGGFAYGGWHSQYFDEASMKWTVDNLVNADAFLFGRRTYETFAAHWPNASDEEQIVAEPLNRKQKFVVSSTLAEPLDWQNSTLLSGDVEKAVDALKHEGNGNLVMPGCAQLTRALLSHNLVDELRLMIDPIVVGGGKGIFPDDGGLSAFELTTSSTTTTGALLLTYKLRR